ncbi:MAG: SRPBCC family protein [Actinomycetota bacterium]|nr:SRPBCC family protein [Actinomycetota bacterium]
MSADNRSPTTADTMTATRRALAPPDTVFAVLADPTTHADIHGAERVKGTVNSGRAGRVDGALDTERITGTGQRFRMAMYHEQHPNKTYETINEVITYEPSSAIAWRTGYLDNGVARFGGWLWRYDLAPADGNSTDVTLTYDWSGATQEARDIIDFPPFGPDHLHNSLAHLVDVVHEHGQ